MLVQGQLQGMDIKATYHDADSGSLIFSVDTGPSGVLAVNVSGTVYLYKLTDILGRIEVQQ